MKYHQAQETFVAELEDGSTRRVTRGEVLPDGHELVRRDQGASGMLFRPLEGGEEEAPAPKGRTTRAAAKVTGKGA